VDFPIAEVSKHAAREKSIRHGHPSTLHLWWARRPLASSRAVLMALLLPDPLDPLCPVDFKSQARTLLAQVQNVGKGDEGLRAGLLKFIGDFANWDLASNQQYLTVSRGLVKAAHPDETPLVVDPFAGGGSIPLEALRLGCDAFASDLNPVAGLIQKVMLEDIPRYGQQKIKVQTEQGEVEADGLAAALRLAGAEIKKAAEKELAQFYPPDPDGAIPIAYLWARTVRCESPNCGAEIPLMRSFWLSKKPNRRRALRSKVIREAGKTPLVEFEIYTPTKESDIEPGTVQRAKATCLCCQTTLLPDRVRAQLSALKGGGDTIFNESEQRIGGARLLSVVSARPGEQGRHYRLANDIDLKSVNNASKYLLASLLSFTDGQDGINPIPNEPTPVGGGSGAGRAFSVQKYGMNEWGDLFTSRQKLALLILAKYISRLANNPTKNILGMLIGKMADFNSNLSRWAAPRETSAATFGRQALPIVWDFCETIPIGNSTGSFLGAIDYAASVIEVAGNTLYTHGQVEQADACDVPLPSDTCSIWFTDPPYYDAIPYSDLSDFFLVWFKRALNNPIFLRDPFNPENLLTPKEREIVQDNNRIVNSVPKDRLFFEKSMARAFSDGRRILKNDGIGCVVFAHKTTEGWEALLSGIIKGGWVITSSWPIATERSGRMRSQDSAALATSVHLVCRPRLENAEIGDWTQVSRELPRKVGDWMLRLQKEGVRGADLVFACIGPALEIYSR
jgi:adenine-specific DNA methylase